MNLKPVEGKVIIEVKKQDEKIGNTKLIMPSAAQEKELGFGLCLSGQWEGKHIYYKKYSGNELEIEGRFLFIVDEEDVLATAD
jgi:co-chaperonin GroES (HSP10)